MISFKLALSNVKKEITNYILYFITLVLSVAIVYAFFSLASSLQFEAFIYVLYWQVQIDNLAVALLSVPVFVAVTFIVLYANKFLFEEKAKTYGIYKVLGINKSKLFSLILIENLILIVSSLILGYVVGQVIITILVAYLEYSLSDLKFIIANSFNFKILIVIAVVFLFLFLINTFKTYKMIEKNDISQLFNKKYTFENKKISNTKLCTTIIFAILFGIGLLLMINVSLPTYTPQQIIIVMVSLALFIYYLYYAIALIIYKVIPKKLYYKEENTFTFRQISKRLSSSIILMSLIGFLFTLVIAGNLFNNALTGYLNNISETIIPDTEIYEYSKVSNYQFPKIDSSDSSENFNFFRPLIIEDKEFLIFSEQTYNKQLNSGADIDLSSEEGLLISNIEPVTSVKLVTKEKDYDLKTNTYASDDENINYIVIDDKLYSENIINTEQYINQTLLKDFDYELYKYNEYYSFDVGLTNEAINGINLEEYTIMNKKDFNTYIKSSDATMKENTYDGYKLYSNDMLDVKEGEKLGKINGIDVYFAGNITFKDEYSNSKILVMTEDFTNQYNASGTYIRLNYTDSEIDEVLDKFVNTYLSNDEVRIDKQEPPSITNAYIAIKSEDLKEYLYIQIIFTIAALYESMILMIVIIAIVSLHITIDAKRNKKEFESLMSIGYSKKQIDRSIKRIVFAFLIAPLAITCFVVPIVIKLLNSVFTLENSVVATVIIILIAIYLVVVIICNYLYKLIIHK